MSALVLATGLALLAAGGGAAPSRVPPCAGREPPAKGKLLVAARQLPDPNFARSVVLLVAYGKDGAMGVIVDRPTRTRLGTALPDVRALADRADTLWFGGPVLPRALLVLLRTAKPPAGGERVFGDVHLFTRRDAVERVLEKTPRRERLRVLAGHAGWAPGQLDAELARGDWLVVPATADLVFADEPDTLWPRLIERAEVIMTRAPGRPACRTG